MLTLSFDYRKLTHMTVMNKYLVSRTDDLLDTWEITKVCVLR